MKRLGAIFFLALLAACGFHLRGEEPLPFATLYVSGGDPAFATELKRTIEASSHTQIIDDPKQAQAVLQILSTASQKRILALSGTGRVREFQLIYQVSFRLADAKNKELIPPSQIALKRDFSFNDTEVLAKESEEALLYRDMQNDAVQQILRRLAVVKL